MIFKLFFFLILFSSCTQNKLSGYIHDFDSDKPIKNVLVNIDNNITKTDSIGFFEIKVNSNSSCIINLKREGYANKKVFRKFNSSGRYNIKAVQNKTIYMFKNESDFAKKN